LPEWDHVRVPRNPGAERVGSPEHFWRLVDEILPVRPPHS
jgi:hypothetical protein